MPLVYIILVNYNGYEDTIECVKSLKSVSYSNYKIVIVDNASTNNSLTYLKSSLKECIIIESKENLGFAGGNNLGIDYALNNGSEYVMLLNNDTLVESNFLELMLRKFKENTDIGLVGCKIMYYPKKDVIWYGGGYIDWFKFIAVHHGAKQVDNGQCDKEKEIDFMTGCCMLIKSEIFEKTGNLSDDYFMYFEDADFCMKVKDTGYKIWYNPKAVIYHKVGLSSGGEESLFSIKWGTRNRLIFMKKYKGKVSKLNYLLSYMFFYTTRIIKCVQYVSKKDNDRAKAIIEGIKMSCKRV